MTSLSARQAADLVPASQQCSPTVSTGRSAVQVNEWNKLHRLVTKGSPVPLVYQLTC